jgi:hypothetical protein
MPPKRKYNSKDETIKQLKWEIKKKGCRIAGLYWTMKCLMQHIENVSNPSIKINFDTQNWKEIEDRITKNFELTKEERQKLNKDKKEKKESDDDDLPVMDLIKKSSNEQIVDNSFKNFFCSNCKTGYSSESDEKRPIVMSCGHMFCLKCVKDFHQKKENKCIFCHEEFRNIIPI